ncbi:hypothetical protein C6503_24850 [Candidatus Poribacteria bacterium]|nr:MAG: hypothetical protein C6503_24850 [Candidatus Poribacteria bacterium]
MRNLVAARKCLVFFLGTLLLAVNIHSTSYGQGRYKIYWTEAGWTKKTGKIRRAHLDGSHVKDIVTELKAPRAIALDMLRRKVYWTDESTRKIQRADLTGRNVKDIITGFTFPPGGRSVTITCRDGKCTGVVYWKEGKIKLTHDLLINPRHIALDVQRKKMYWVNEMLKHIQRANLDGSDVEDLVTYEAFSNALTLDRNRGKMYWTDYSRNAIRRANFDGSNVENVVATMDEPVSLALDVARGKIYWTVWIRGFDGPRTIQRADLDGSNLEEIFTSPDQLKSLALDPVGGKIYWITSESKTHTGTIQRANLDGSKVENIITGLNNPWSIALDFPGVRVTPSIDKLTTTWGKMKVE